MKHLISIFLLLLFVSALAFPVLAEEISPSATQETSVEESVEQESEQTDSRMLTGVLLLSAVGGAMVVSTLLFKERDRTKYL